MELQVIIIQLVAILTSARIMAEVANRFGAPPVVGEIFAGVILGPSLLGWIHPHETLRLLAEIGIILLLFGVGLETDLTRLTRAGGRALRVAIVGFVLPFFAGFAASHYLFDLPVLVSAFIGGTLTATSIGVTIRILSNLKRLHSIEGEIVLGAAVVDDILGVILLAVLYEFSVSGGVSLVHAGRVVIFISLFFVLAPVAAKLMAVIIDRVDSSTEIPGLIPTTILSLVLLFAWLAHAVGAPFLLGSFAAGLALSRRFFLPFGISIATHPAFSRHIALQMRPIIQLFTPIFFVVVGLSLNLRAVDWGSTFIWTFSLGLAAIAIVCKMAGGFVLREEVFPRRMVVGMAMVPRAEVGLIFAELGRAAGIFDEVVYAGLIIVIAYTTLLSPFWIKWFYSVYGKSLDISREGTAE